MNTPQKHQALEHWIREALTDPDKDEPCTMLSLMHIKGTTGGGILQDEIHTMKIGERVYEPRTLAETFRRKAQGFAQELPGTQSFMLLAFYGGSKEPGAKHPFRETGALDMEGLATEPPNETGKTMQSMRLTEAIVQGSFRQNADVFATLMRAFDVLSIQNAQLIGQNHEAFGLLKDIMMQRATENHEYALKEKDREMVAKLLSFAPPLVNQIFGAEVFPQSSSDSALIDSLIDNINSEEELQKLSTAVPPKVWPILAQRMEEKMKQRMGKKPNVVEQAKKELEIEDEPKSEPEVVQAVGAEVVEKK